MVGGRRHMTPLQASVLLNEAIELLEARIDNHPESRDVFETEAILDRLRSFRDGFFRNIRTKNNHPVKVPEVPLRQQLKVMLPEDWNNPLEDA
jgi:hypothetical protein